MATDFQLIEAYNVDIENFSYDVSDMVDSIYIGPQGELLEKLEYFNHSYNCNIGVTKAFTLKPGGYDEIKKAYARWVLRHDLKPRGIKSLFDRIHQYNWRANGFKQQILDIDTRMKTLKQSGMRWQNNTDQFEEEFDKLKSSIISALSQTREMYPNIDLECKIIPVSEGRLTAYRHRGDWGRRGFPSSMFASNPVDFIIMFYLKIKNTDMITHVMDEEGAINEYRIPMGDVHIISGTYLLPLISRHWGRTTPMTTDARYSSHSFFLEALYLSEMDKSDHPYIGKSNDKYAWELKQETFSSNICTGNMETEIRNSLLNNEIMAHIVQLITWMTNYYVPQTHPLNRINRMRSFGDDIKFVQWRNDLNATSPSVFRSPIADLPEECNLSSTIYGEMYGYAINRNRNSYYNTSRSFGIDSIEYPLRLEEYLNKIDLDDMPCNNCSFKSECNQWDTIQVLFKDSLTPQEESYIGVIYEFFEFTKDILESNPESQNRFVVHFVEMSVGAAWRWKLDEDYFRMVLCHQMTIWWAYLNSETFNTVAERYRYRMKALWQMSTRDMKHLFKHHHANKDSIMPWTVDSIRAYRAPTLDDEPDNDQVIENWLRRDDESNALDLDMIDAEENMTPEQRAIQWAIQHGGAQNL